MFYLPLFLFYLRCQFFLKADVEKASKKKFPILVVETVGEKQNEILVKENEDLDTKIAKESLLAEKVFEHPDGIDDGKTQCELHSLFSLVL